MFRSLCSSDVSPPRSIYSRKSSGFFFPNPTPPLKKWDGKTHARDLQPRLPNPRLPRVPVTGPQGTDRRATGGIAEAIMAARSRATRRRLAIVVTTMTLLFPATVVHSRFFSFIPIFDPRPSQSCSSPAATETCCCFNLRRLHVSGGGRRTGLW